MRKGSVHSRHPLTRKGNSHITETKKTIHFFEIPLPKLTSIQSFSKDIQCFPNVPKRVVKHMASMLHQHAMYVSE